jgi:hypothetical protein
MSVLPHSTNRFPLQRIAENPVFRSNSQVSNLL